MEKQNTLRPLGETLYRWQSEALDGLAEHNYRGIIVACTASGKTRVGLELFKRLKVKTLIVVPTIVLMNQWKDELEKIGLKKQDLGLYYGKVKNFNLVTIAVVNSIYELRDLGKQFSLIIMDEIHRMGAEEFSKLLLNNTFQYSVGLTATLERSDGNHALLTQKVGDIICNYTLSDAHKDGIIQSFSIINKAVDLPYNEQEYLTRLNLAIKVDMEKFGGDFGRVTEAIKKGNMSAARILKNVHKRKKFFNNSRPKVEEAFKVIVANMDKQIIVFNEYTETADALYLMLKEKGIKALVYYSSNKKEQSLFTFTTQQKQQIIESFLKGEVNILIAVKALDEGLNVKGAAIGINVGYNSTSRQGIQRMGRILRKSEGKNPVMYNFYYRNTSDLYNAKKFSSHFGNEANIVWT